MDGLRVPRVYRTDLWVLCGGELSQWAMEERQSSHPADNAAPALRHSARIQAYYWQPLGIGNRQGGENAVRRQRCRLMPHLRADRSGYPANPRLR